MARVFFHGKTHSVGVETWLSDGGGTELNDIPTRRPTTIKHCIAVYWTAGYATDFKVDGYIAAARPPLSFLQTTNPDSWEKTIPNVTSNSPGQESCEMGVTVGSLMSRIQCTKVEYLSAWQGGWNQVLSNPLELQIPVN